MTASSLSRRVTLPFEHAVSKLRETLATEGFGVVTERLSRAIYEV